MYKLLKLQNSDAIVTVDFEDHKRLSSFMWYINPNGNVYRAYYGEKNPYSGKRPHIFVSLAKEVMQVYDKMFDHKDRNPLNNKKSNLRIATYSQNNTNKGKLERCHSDYVGVSFRKGRKAHWQASIRHNKKLIHLGCFKIEENAALAYDIKAFELYGESANLNFG